MSHVVASTSVEETLLEKISADQRAMARLTKQRNPIDRESLKELSLVLVGVLISIPREDRKTLDTDAWGIHDDVKPIIESLLQGDGSVSRSWFERRGCKFVGTTVEWLMRSIRVHYSRMFLELSASSVAKQIIGEMTPERLSALESYVAELKRAMEIQQSEVPVEPSRK